MTFFVQEILRFVQDFACRLPLRRVCGSAHAAKTAQVRISPGAPFSNMSAYRHFLVGFILATVASAQQSTNPVVSSQSTCKLEGRIVASGEWIQINGPVIVDSMNMDKILFASRSLDRPSERFAFWPLPPGTYTVQVSGLSRQHQWISTTQKIVLEKDLTDVELALLPGTSISVTVRKESKEPVSRCWWNPMAEELNIPDCSDYKAANVELVPVEGRRSPYSSSAGVEKDPTHFTIEGIEPGKYIVRVELPSYPGNYVQSVRSGNLDLLHEELDVAKNDSVLPIEIVLRDDFGVLKIQTRGAAQLPVIVLLREDVLSRKPWLPIHFNEADSSFPVAPGSYAVFAFDSVEGNYTDPEVLSKHAERAVRVTIGANERKNIQLDLIHIED